MSDRAPELKIWCAIRTDIEIPPGKLATQAGHAYCGALVEGMKSRPAIVTAYLASATPKITVRADNEDALLRIYRDARTAGIPCSLVRDAGRTVFNEPTHTAVGFGPCLKSDLPSFLKRLQLF